MRWKTEHTVLATVSTGLIATDCIQTYHKAVLGNYVETNPLLGRKPTAERLAIMCGAAMVGNVVIGWAIPAKARRWWFRAVIVVEAIVVIHNASI